MTYEQKYELIQQLISQSDFRRAIFVLYNKNSNLRVRKNIFQFYLRLKTLILAKSCHIRIHITRKSDSDIGIIQYIHISSNRKSSLHFFHHSLTIRR